MQRHKRIFPEFIFPFFLSALRWNKSCHFLQEPSLYSSRSAFPAVHSSPARKTRSVFGGGQNCGKKLWELRKHFILALVSGGRGSVNRLGVSLALASYLCSAIQLSLSHPLFASGGSVDFSQPLARLNPRFRARLALSKTRKPVAIKAPYGETFLLKSHLL